MVVVVKLQYVLLILKIKIYYIMADSKTPITYKSFIPQNDMDQFLKHLKKKFNESKSKKPLVTAMKYYLQNVPNIEMWANFDCDRIDYAKMAKPTFSQKSDYMNYLTDSDYSNLQKTYKLDNNSKNAELKYSSVPNIFVDFSNDINLGGGVFGRGFVQEEEMFLKSNFFPTLLNDIIFSNDKQIKEDLYDNPYDNPKIIKATMYDYETNKQRDDLIYKSNNRKEIYMLAISAKNILRDSNSKRANPILNNNDYYLDLFNACCKVFTKIKDIYYKRYFYYYVDNKNNKELNNGIPILKIHTGRWGCGAFGNCGLCMILIQMYAARYVGGINLIFYDTSNKPIEYYKNYINRQSNLVRQKSPINRQSNLVRQKSPINNILINHWKSELNNLKYSNLNQISHLRYLNNTNMTKLFNNRIVTKQMEYDKAYKLYISYTNGNKSNTIRTIIRDTIKQYYYIIELKIIKKISNLEYSKQKQKLRRKPRRKKSPSLKLKGKKSSKHIPIGSKKH
jgi:hypothetical protein